jgi:hypothetical protein
MWSRRLVLAGLALAGIGLVAAALVGVTALLRDEEPDSVQTVRRPAPGEVRPDYLSDGTPVWVIGHEDGSVDVLSGFDTHRPFNIGKVLWWCPSAHAFENPEHGSRYDEYGLRIGGPAPTGLPAYETVVNGSRVSLGDLQGAPPPDARHSGPGELDRDWCTFPEDDVVFHSFDDWPIWESPTEAVATAPDGWILLEGGLAIVDGQVGLCGVSGCDDAVRAASVPEPDPGMGIGPLFGDRFIARVRDGVLTDLTRVMPAPAQPLSRDANVGFGQGIGVNTVPEGWEPP